ncbi:hypothetical protein BU021_11550 [Staphylococcus simulans]|uniref:hypothetical protein n=1 Tax=Staphylococcus simulans TaxID=1286 RepID=UPI000D1E35B8|nr:hypothetical protein [Staphylococcus simulans]PTI93416.1 hypothetical protein BU045_05810 [Staphylococcus simulans]PTJ02224.1 hypothetical protein BU046_12510 [Staphylococcus simulans]PTJ38201.1 hypothetical protein BU021_11550 [Staphylococcus simulans]PTJ97152.1 hypothetical protein BU013_04935 [Staphylococcus simulans]
MENFLLILIIALTLFLLFPVSIFIIIVSYAIKEKREFNNEWERIERRYQEFNEKVNKRMEEEGKYLDEKKLKRNLSELQRGSSAKDFKYYGK